MVSKDQSSFAALREGVREHTVYTRESSALEEIYGNVCILPLTKCMRMRSCMARAQRGRNKHSLQDGAAAVQLMVLCAGYSHWLYL